MTVEQQLILIIFLVLVVMGSIYLGLRKVKGG
jgi:hypothetical protein